ncbi:hypothetical protein ACTWP6_17710 [Mycobacterium sp. 4D054]|uniref:hypothetical protein n=1 Tax=Mycobacterium sp. 4D054 TaxID=3457440 RepID=UPI003FD45D35
MPNAQQNYRKYVEDQRRIQESFKRWIERENKRRAQIWGQFYLDMGKWTERYNKWILGQGPHPGSRPAPPRIPMPRG